MFWWRVGFKVVVSENAFPWGHHIFKAEIKSEKQDDKARGKEFKII